MDIFGIPKTLPKEDKGKQNIRLFLMIGTETLAYFPTKESKFANSSMAGWVQKNQMVPVHKLSYKFINVTERKTCRP